MAEEASIDAQIAAHFVRDELGLSLSEIRAADILVAGGNAVGVAPSLGGAAFVTLTAQDLKGFRAEWDGG